MHLERHLKEIKQSFPSFYGAPYAETVSIMSPVGRLWRHHWEDGGANPFSDDREDMAAEGLPMQRFQSTSGKTAKAPVAAINRLQQVFDFPPSSANRKCRCMGFRRVAWVTRRQS